MIDGQFLGGLVAIICLLSLAIEIPIYCLDKILYLKGSINERSR